MNDLSTLSNEQLVQRILDTLTDEEAAALTSACVIASALGQDRPDIRTARACADLACANPERVLAFLGYVPMKGRVDGWVNVEKGAHGKGLVGNEQTLGMFVFKHLGGVLRANLQFNQASEE